MRSSRAEKPGRASIGALHGLIGKLIDQGIAGALRVTLDRATLPWFAILVRPNVGRRRRPYVPSAYRCFVPALVRGSGRRGLRGDGEPAAAQAQPPTLTEAAPKGKRRSWPRVPEGSATPPAAEGLRRGRAGRRHSG
jgi:hypothetical protein